jgi:acyl carrier protein
MIHETQDSSDEAFSHVVATVLEVDPGELVDAAGPHTLPTWTSLRHLQLIVTLEEAFGISFEYHEIRGLRSIGDVRDALSAKRAAPPATASSTT